MRLFLLMILAVFSAPLHADVRGDVYHDVRIDIREGDRVIGQPHFIMADNGVATITSAKPDGYALKVTLAPAPNGRADMRKVSLELHLVQGGRWSKLGEPYLVGLIDREMSTTVSRPGKASVRMSIVVASNFDGKLSASTARFGRNTGTAVKLARWSRAMRQPVAFNAVQLTDTPGGCCSAGCDQTCCSDGPMCCGDDACPGSGCCN